MQTYFECDDQITEAVITSEHQLHPDQNLYDQLPFSTFIHQCIVSSESSCQRPMTEEEAARLSAEICCSLRSLAFQSWRLLPRDHWSRTSPYLRSIHSSEELRGDSFWKIATEQMFSATSKRRVHILRRHIRDRSFHDNFKFAFSDPTQFLHALSYIYCYHQNFNYDPSGNPTHPQEYTPPLFVHFLDRTLIDDVRAEVTPLAIGQTGQLPHQSFSIIVPRY